MVGQRDVYYEDVEVTAVRIVKYGGESNSRMISGIPQSRQGKYTGPQYKGGNGTYVSIDSQSYEPVHYKVFLLTKVTWNWAGKDYKKYRSFDVTEYVNRYIHALEGRLTKASMQLIETMLKDQSYAVVHRDSDAWEVFTDVDKDFVYVGEAVFSKEARR